MDEIESEVPQTALTPYLGRFVRLEVSQDGLDRTVRGFLTEIKGGVFIVDEGMEYVEQKYITRAYNIASELIAGVED